MKTRFLPGCILLILLLTGCGHAAPETAAPTLPETQAVTVPPAQSSQPETIPPETQPGEEHFLLTFAGDCTFGSNPTNYFADYGFIKTVGEDYAYPFANVIDYFANDEFSMVNLEGPLCDEGNPVQKKHVFHGPTAYVNCLTENSIEAVTVANNHSMDYGASGYASTLAVLEQAGVPYVERDSTAVVTTENSLTIGLYAAVYYKLDVEDMTAKIAALREQGVDLVIFAPTGAWRVPTAPPKNRSGWVTPPLTPGRTSYSAPIPTSCSPLRNTAAVSFSTLWGISASAATAPPGTTTRRWCSRRSSGTGRETSDWDS